MLVSSQPKWNLNIRHIYTTIFVSRPFINFRQSVYRIPEIFEKSWRKLSFYSVSFEYNCNLPEVEGHMFMLLIVAEVQSLQVIMSKCFGRNAKLSLCSINIYTVSFLDKYVLFRVVCILGEEYNH